MIHTHDGEEHTAFIPSSLHRGAEHSGELVQRRMLELIKPFRLTLTSDTHDFILNVLVFYYRVSQAQHAMRGGSGKQEGMLR